MDGGAMDGPPRKESHAYKIYIPVYFFLAFSPLMVIIRALSHKRARGRFGVDDIAITASLVSLIPWFPSLPSLAWPSLTLPHLRHSTYLPCSLCHSLLRYCYQVEYPIHSDLDG